MLAGYPPPGYCRKCGMFLGGSPKIHEKVCFGSAGKPPPPYVDTTVIYTARRLKTGVFMNGSAQKVYLN